INDGNFYHAFIHVFFETDGNGLIYVKLNGSYTILYFLKDIISTCKSNHKNQLQVNISTHSEYRTRQEFITVLISKMKEIHERQIKISNKALKEIDVVERILVESNK